VPLLRTVGADSVGVRDPFLRLDEIRTSDPAALAKGFAWHPHRGQDLVTYLIDGRMQYEDSLGTAATIGPGELQWLSAAGGVVHRERPHLQHGRFWGFKLWVNLPARLKHSQPRYRAVRAADVPHIHTPSGALVRVLAGEVGDAIGPVEGAHGDPVLLDAGLPSESALQLALPRDRTVLAYLCDGAVLADGPDGFPTTFAAPALLEFGPGAGVGLEARDEGARLLVLAALPLREPLAMHGSFVMNTREDLRQAYEDYSRGRLEWSPAAERDGSVKPG